MEPQYANVMVRFIVHFTRRGDVHLAVRLGSAVWQLGYGTVLSAIAR